MSKKRRSHSSQFKFKVALEAAKNDKTRSEIATQFGVSGAQVSQWKKELTDNGQQLFERKNDRKQKLQENEEAKLYEQAVGIPFGHRATQNGT